MTLTRGVVWAAGFFPWHFLLRRLGVRLPTRSSARIYASVALPVGTAGAGWPWRALAAVLVARIWLSHADGQRRSGGRSHFDTLAPDYATQLSPIARERVVERKTALMAQAMEQAGIASDARLLDAGCGHGWYLDALTQRGYRAIGADLSPQQVAAARHAGGASRGNAPLLAASVLALPLSDASMDAAFAVNVLHHVQDRAAQSHALAELARVVRPGGLVFLHEINTRNPLFRFYMVYVFPLWKRIDLGTEEWLDARRLPTAPGLTLQRVHQYTFLPDFAPARLVHLLSPLEKRLERSWIAPWSAHFTAVYRTPTA